MVDRVYNRPRPIKQQVGATERRVKWNENDENQMPEANNQHPENRLSGCSWKFWHEPDQNNFGPQLIVTEPDGQSHYLLDPETYERRVRLCVADFGVEEEEELVFAHNGVTTATAIQQIILNMGEDGDWEKGMNEPKYAKDWLQDMLQRSHEASTETDKAQWKTKLRGGLMQTWKKRSSGTILPLHNTLEESNSSSWFDSSEEKEESRIGRGIFNSGQHCHNDPEGTSMFLEVFRVLGILRTIAKSCCP